MKRKYSINDCEKLIDRLFNSYNISLKECSKKRDELKNIGVNWGKKNYDHQTLEDFFLSNSVWSIDELENTGFFLEDVKEEKQEVEIDKAIIWVRAKFKPFAKIDHDSYFKSGVMEFSDGSTHSFTLERTPDGQEIKFPKQKTKWVKFTKLVPNKNLWCGFTEVQIWGK